MNKALQDALQCLLSNYGDSVLQDTNRLIGTIADFAPNNLKEKKMINIVIYENIPANLIRIKNKNIDIKQIEINKCTNKLEEEYGMRKEIAEKIISYFTIALGYGTVRNGVLSNISNQKTTNNNKYFDSLTIAECIKLGENNHLKIQLYLGNQYLKGTRVKKNNKKAMYWFEKASKQNDLAALCNLAILRLSEKRA